MRLTLKMDRDITSRTYKGPDWSFGLSNAIASILLGAGICRPHQVLAQAIRRVAEEESDGGVGEYWPGYTEAYNALTKAAKVFDDGWTKSDKELDAKCAKPST